MHCAKCGREIPEHSVFCEKCLEVMKQYPVKPGTSIQLPQRKPPSPKRPTPHKRKLPPEEQVVQQRKTIRWLCVTLVCLLLMLVLSISLLFHMMPEEVAEVTIGQNYITRESTSEP